MKTKTVPVPGVFPIPDEKDRWSFVEYNFCVYCGSAVFRNRDQSKWPSWTWNGWMHWATLQVKCGLVPQPDWKRYFSLK